METKNSKIKCSKQYHSACDLIPPMSGDEFKALVEDVKQNGLRNPIRVLDGAVIDGRSRLAACERAGTTPRFETVEKSTDPVDYVISQNLHRRHLSDDTRAGIAAKLREGWSVVARRNRAKRAADRRHHKGCPVAAPATKQERTHIRAARLMGVSENKVRRAIELLKASAPRLEDVIRSGKTLASALAEVRAERYAEDNRTKARRLDDEARGDLARLCEFRHCGMDDLLSSKEFEGKIDLILTDPDWNKVGDYGRLASCAKRCLSADGILAAMVGLKFMRDAILAIGDEVPYRWTIAYLTDQGPLALVPGTRQLPNDWKPVLVYSRSKRWDETLNCGVVRSPRREKSSHIWQQSVSGFAQLVRILSRPGSLVVDPFCGSGTTGLACLEAGGRFFVGCDVDGKAIRDATERRDAVGSEILAAGTLKEAA